MSTGLERIEQLVEQYPKRKLQTLMHLVNEEAIIEKHNEQVTGKATGIDKVTKSMYGQNIKENAKALIAQMKTFSYRPQPVRRTHIPKEGSEELRPLGIPAYEDKLVQGVMAEILTVIYEPKFYDFSYGFREGRNAHQAIKFLGSKLMGYTSWVVDADIKSFFDTVNHEWMMKFLEHDIEDKNFLRYIKRFLKSGVMDEGKLLSTDQGVPQGGCISAILANVYLHYTIDKWFELKAKKMCRGISSMVRYADDIVFCFQYEDDARNFYKALKNRLAEFGLTLSETKSKIIKFGRFAGREAGKFDFLGFTHIAAKSRKGKFIVKYRTSQKKLKTKKAKVQKWLRKHMHSPTDEVIKRLNQKLRGHYNYYGITHNYSKLKEFQEYIKRQLFVSLRRRGGGKKLNWEKFNRILTSLPLLEPRITVPLW